MPYLAISSNGKAPQRQPLGGPSVLGRALGSEFWIEDRKLSRQHCRFEETHDGWAVIDLNSTNGTYVRGQRVSYHVLSDGDEIIVG
ncbi:MAG: FHA domain-containing protein, partial [Tepidisphaeraceae bacterium]